MTAKFKRLSPVLIKRWVYMSGPTLAHWCPACAELHDFHCDSARTDKAQWQWDGDVEQPTFTPAMDLRVGDVAPQDGTDQARYVCNYTITDGIITYSEESTHGMRGQTVAMTIIPEVATKWLLEAK